MKIKSTLPVILACILFAPHLSLAYADTLYGKFSISATQQIHFAPGNLQYHSANKIWRFAEHQWDYIGESNTNTSSNYDGWIDLFGWGTGSNPTNFFMDEGAYTAFSDWGNNTISNGDNLQWRTLTNDEWGYIFNERKTESGIRFAKAKVNGVNGVILLPDNWDNTTYRIKYANKEKADFSSNTLSASKWSNLEQAGAVFIPAAGCRWGTTANHTGSYGYYWSSTVNSNLDSYGVFFDNRSLLPQSLLLKEYGFSVRLVCPVE